jgi:hypothetical protein
MVFVDTIAPSNLDLVSRIPVAYFLWAATFASLWVCRMMPSQIDTFAKTFESGVDYLLSYRARGEGSGKPVRAESSGVLVSNRGTPQTWEIL